MVPVNTAHRILRPPATQVTVYATTIFTNPKKMCDLQVTSLALVPPVAVYLAKHPALDKYDLSSLLSVSCGAAPLQADVERALNVRLPGDVKVGQGDVERP